ncbi:MAG: transcriptional regulator [Gammaproteobacteria bacterium]|nr:MAG: transcriptional regulator [Gammaproteobacteria bacterium]RLA61191.1 MAG: transcriptional regulator [Gammaproteobacteria bacterium]
MLIETGRVVAVDPDGLWVETIRQSTCGTCAAQKGCGHALLNRISDGKRGYIRVLPGDRETGECRIDDQVRISIPAEVILRGSLVVYILPLACMLAGAAAAVGLVPGSQDVLAALGAALGFGVGFALVRWHAWRHRDDRSLQPTLVEILCPLKAPVTVA